MIHILIKRTYQYNSDGHEDHYLLAGTRDECIARVKRIIRNNPKTKIRKSANGDFWHVTPPGGADQGFFGHKPLDLLIVNAPEIHDQGQGGAGGMTTPLTVQVAQ